MSWIDTETKRKLREAQDETLVLGMAFEERLRPVVDKAHSGFTRAKVAGLIRRAGATLPGRRTCVGSTSWTNEVWTGT